jgi:beta-ribofuranosylaminobenzene 5'-phosphate synthase
MIRVTAPSRLHFGLFHIPSEQDAGAPIPPRQYGGVGLMIDKPGVELSLSPAKAWSATGPCADRAFAFAQEFMRQCPGSKATFALAVERCAAEHVGLGTGTQLGLAVAKALAIALGRPDWHAAELARRVGRGLRSGIGVHGFDKGGLIVDGGKGVQSTVAPLVARHEFPDTWAILLIVPKQLQGVHGDLEREALAQLAKWQSTLETDALCRLVLLGVLPALVEQDLPAFGEALYEFNRRVGAMFKPWQGGVYANPSTEALIAWLRNQGVKGVGQSSWGPAVFAIDTTEKVTSLGELARNEEIGADNEIHACHASKGWTFTGR